MTFRYHLAISCLVALTALDVVSFRPRTFGRWKCTVIKIWDSYTQQGDEKCRKTLLDQRSAKFVAGEGICELWPDFTNVFEA